MHPRDQTVGARANEVFGAEIAHAVVNVARWDGERAVADLDTLGVV
jgi:hypothetical protein